MTEDTGARSEPAGARDRRGICLAGGGLRLSWQAGVLRALLEQGLDFRYIDATSAGGLNTAMWLSGQPPEEMCSAWRRQRPYDALQLRPLTDYLRVSSLVALGDSGRFRKHVLPALGIDLERVRAATDVEAWFNVLDYSRKVVECVPHEELDEDWLIAGLSLPGVFPPVERDRTLYLDAGYVRDANPLEAVRRGASEIWIAWPMANGPDYRGGPVDLYVQSLDMSANGALNEDLLRIAELNERIRGGEAPYGLTSPVVVHLVRPERPLPLDVDLYNGTTTHSTLVDLGYQDAWRYLQQMKPGGVSLAPEVTRMEPEMAGITFRETMSGPFTLGSTDPRDGEQRGREIGTTLAMHASVTIDDLDRFIGDPEHAGGIAGHIDFAPMGYGIPARRGRFNLFSPTDDPRLRHMVYEFAFTHEGKPYYLAGRKEVRDEHGLDLWSDTTTLLTTLHEGDGPEGRVIGAGILRLGVDDLVRLVSTVRVTGVEGPADQAAALAQFGRFFMGELWDRYAPLAPGRSSLRGRLRDRARSVLGSFSAGAAPAASAASANAGRLPTRVIEVLLPYADERSLRSLRVRTGTPWTWLPQMLRASAVTLGSNVLFREGRYRDDHPSGLALIAHEAIHVRQYREHGLPGFLLRYGIGLVRSRFVHDDHPLELEPEAVQRRAREELSRRAESA